MSLAPETVEYLLEQLQRESRQLPRGSAPGPLDDLEYPEE